MLLRQRKSLVVAGLVLTLGAGLTAFLRLESAPAKTRVSSATPAFPRSFAPTSPATLTSGEPSSPTGLLSNVRSCKPSAPVQVTIEAASIRGRWRIELRALEAAGETRVFMGTGTPAAGPKRLVWQGALAAGEVRRIEVPFSTPVDASPVWVEAETASQPGSALRSIATFAAPGEAPNARAMLRDTGHIVTDPRSGETFYEYPGQVSR